MEMVHVFSTNIDSVGYEDNTLYVRFKRGGIYAYNGVPRNLYTNLLNAGSKGQYFADFIKDFFPCVKLR